MPILNVIGPFLPAIIGAMLISILLKKTIALTPNCQLLICGVGGLAGYLALSVVMSTLNKYGFQVFRIEFLISLYILALVIFVVWILIFKCTWPHLRPRKIAALTAFGAVTIFAGYQSILSPVASWDSFELWAALAAPYIDFDAGRTGGQVYTIQHWRHPWTVVNFSAFSAYVSSFTHLQWGTLTAWYAAWMCIAMITSGTVYLLSKSTILGGIAFYFFTVTPLMENHAILHGYADLWIAAVVSASCGLLVAGICIKQKLLLYFAMLTFSLPLTLKASGAIYGVCLWLAALTTLTTAKYGALKAVIWLIGLCAFFLLALCIGFDAEILGTRLAITADDTRTLWFSGYVYELKYYSIKKALWNIFFALTVNTSFSILMLLLLFSLWSSVFLSKSVTADYRSASLFLMLSVTFIILAFLAPQLIAGYADEYSIPTHDTGGSRFMLAIVSPTIMLFGLWSSVVLRSLDDNQKN